MIPFRAVNRKVDSDKKDQTNLLQQLPVFTINSEISIIRQILLGNFVFNNN